MRTIQIPDFSYHSILGALYAEAGRDLDNGWDALASNGTGIAKGIIELNGDALPDVELTEVGALCHCDQRDANEIAVYFKADELLSLQALLETVTFGNISDGVSVLHLWRSMCEIDDVITDRLDGPSLR